MDSTGSVTLGSVAGLSALVSLMFVVTKHHHSATLKNEY